MGKEDKYESGKGNAKTYSKVDRRINTKVGNEREKTQSKVEKRINMKVAKEQEKKI